MALAFAALSLLGLGVFWSAGDHPVAILFLSLTYLTAIPTRLFAGSLGGRTVGLWRFLPVPWGSCTDLRRVGPLQTCNTCMVERDGVLVRACATLSRRGRR